MELFEYGEKERWPISVQDIPRLQKPVLLYLGCLSHIRDRHINPQFYNYLARLKGNADVHVIAPVNRHADDRDLAVLRRNFNDATSGIHPDAEFIYKNFYAPLIDKCLDFDDPDFVRDLKNDLSRVSLFGYSYGTCFLQQIADAMAADLLQRLGTSPEGREKAFEICQSVKSIAIGPTGRLRSIDNQGRPSPLLWNDPEFGLSPTVFSQMLFLMRHDMVTQGAYGDEPLGGIFQSETGIECRRTKAAMLVIDYTPSPVMKVAGYVDNEGQPDPKIWQTTDTLIHDHRSYTYMFERQGTFMLWQTLAVTPVLRAAMCAMLSPEAKGPDWIESLHRSVSTTEQRHALVARRDAADLEFTLLQQQLSALPDNRKGSFIQDYLDGVYGPEISQAREDTILHAEKSARLWNEELEKAPELSAAMECETLRVFVEGTGRQDSVLNSKTDKQDRLYAIGGNGLLPTP